MKLSIFTPTYNRAQLLIRLFNSLQQQICLDFEWLIIDDGSSDDTHEIVRSFQDIAQFPVRYFWKENGGKHTAYNFALAVADGEWMVCVDSDDQLTNDAVVSILRGIEAVPGAKGVIAYKANAKGQRLGSELPQRNDSILLYELGVKYNCTGDYLFALETKTAKKHPFPIFQGEKFVPESVVWDSLGSACRFSIVRKNLMLCEYQSDGYTSDFANLMKQNPSGFCLYFLQQIDLQPRLLQRVIHAGKYWCFRWICKRKELAYKGKHKILVALAIIPGICFRMYYRLFRGI